MKKNNNIMAMVKLLEKIDYNPTSKSKSVLFFPIEVEEEVCDGLIMTGKSESGYVSSIKQGIVLEKIDNETVCCIGYASVEYAKEFNLKQYLQVLTDMSDREINNLSGALCYLVPESNLLSEYYINPPKPEKEKKKSKIKNAEYKIVQA